MNRKIRKRLKLLVDYTGFVIFFLFTLVVLLFGLPWILRQRSIWLKTSKGNNRALFIQGMTIGKMSKRGYEYLLPFRNPSLRWIGFFDPANSQDTDLAIANDAHIILRKTPKFLRWLDEIGLEATSIPLRELLAVFRTIKYCVEQHIGVLRAYKHDYAALRAYLTSRLIGIPYLVDISINFALVERLAAKKYYFKQFRKFPLIGFFDKGLTYWLYGLPLRHAFRVFGRSKCAYEHAFALGTPVERLSLLRISNFDDRFSTFDRQKMPPRPIEYPYFLFVGRLTAVKYPIDVIDAFNLAASQLPDYRLILIGDGSLRPNIEEKIERSEHKDRIILTGVCSSEEVFAWTAHAAASICPFSGSTLAEAMLCEVPVIAYDVAGHAELVIDDYTGFLVLFRDIEALAERMVYVGRNAEAARSVAIQGRGFALAVFDKKRIREKESLFYTQALAE
jgi:glycosyltransferase involved in cell wall biosynthesis